MPGTNPFDNGSVSERMITLNETWADLTEFDPLHSGERGQAAEESRMGEDGRPVLDVQQGEERLPDIAAEQGGMTEPDRGEEHRLLIGVQ